MLTTEVNHQDTEANLAQLYGKKGNAAQIWQSATLDRSRMQHTIWWNSL